MILVVLGFATCRSRFFAARTVPLDGSSMAALRPLFGGAGGRASASVAARMNATLPTQTEVEILLNCGKKLRCKIGRQYRLGYLVVAMIYYYSNKNSHLLAILA